MLLQLKRLITPYPHRPWRMPRRLLALSLVLFGFIAWLLGAFEKPWPPMVNPGPVTTQPGTTA